MAVWVGEARLISERLGAGPKKLTVHGEGARPSAGRPHPAEGGAGRAPRQARQRASRRRDPWPRPVGLWPMAYGLWSMVYGLRSMVYGLWFVVDGLWSTIHGL